jgi:hypothetical protein
VVEDIDALRSIEDVVYISAGHIEGTIGKRWRRHDMVVVVVVAVVVVVVD